MIDKNLEDIFNDKRLELKTSLPIVCSLDLIITLVTEMFLKVLNENRGHWQEKNLAEDLFFQTKQLIMLYNATQSRGNQLKYTALLPMQIADLINFLYHVRQISCAGDRDDADSGLLGIYQTAGMKKGLYDYDRKTHRRIIRKLKRTTTNGEIAEVQEALRDIVPNVDRNQDRDLIPVNNGIFNYKTKTLIPFSPDYVFLSKSRVDYNPNAQNVHIHNPDDGTDWDVESWMNELSDDPEVVELLWQIMGAILRPFVRWDKCAIFYANTGNNGKGTLCQLMRNLCGKGRYASVPVAAFGTNFLLEELPNAMAIITDENDFGGYLDKAGNFKAVITNDVIQINRKNRSAISFQFFGFMVQCFNDYPKIKDKSDSIYRRCLFVPFDKCFTGKVRRYIKDTYLYRSDVLEYVMFRVLNMNYYKLSEPAACRYVLDDYKEFNDPLRQWWNEVSGQFVWDLLPWEFLYPVYTKWFAANNPSGKVVGSRGFIDAMRKLVETDDIWMCPVTVDKKGKKSVKQVSPSGRIMCDEPLGRPAMNGQMSLWQNRTYRGLLRRVPTPRPPQVQNPANSNPYYPPPVTAADSSVNR